MLDEKIAGEGQRKSGRGGEDVEGVMGDNGMHRQVLDDAGEDRGGLDLSDRRGGGRERESESEDTSEEDECTKMWVVTEEQETKDLMMNESLMRNSKGGFKKGSNGKVTMRSCEVCLLTND